MINIRRLIFILTIATGLLVALIILAGCNLARIIHPVSEPVTAVTSTPLPTHLPRPVVLVQQDLAERLNVPLNSVEVLQVIDMVWPDTCLGLPAPALCAPGETPGYRITLGALGQKYTYHTDKNEMFRYAGPGDYPQRP